MAVQLCADFERAADGNCIMESARLDRVGKHFTVEPLQEASEVKRIIGQHASFHVERVPSGFLQLERGG